MKNIKDITISVLIPTRERPQLLERTIRSIRDTLVHGVEIVVAVDADDPCLDEYKELIPKYIGARMIISKDDHLSNIYNQMAGESTGDFILCGNDDFVWRTPCWDKLVKEKMLGEFPDGICMGWCNDGTPKSKDRCPAPIVTRKWMDILGYFVPKDYYHLYCDEWVKSLGELSQRYVYMDDILIEHCHIGQGKAKKDSTYARWRTQESQKKKKRDQKKYNNEELKRIKDAEKLRVAGTVNESPEVYVNKDIDMETPIFISGCARSGTSMVAGIIDKCGAFGGETTPPLPHNKKGQFENDALRNILKSYIAEQGYDKLGQKPLPELDKLEDWSQFKDHFENVFESQGYKGGPCYYKGAKLCLIWPAIHKNYPNAKWVFVRRPDDDIIRSCLKTSFMRKRKTAEEWQIWINHHLYCLSQMKENGLDVTEIWSSKLIEGDFSEIKSFVEKVGLEWDEDVVRDFVEPKLYGDK